MAKTPVRPSSKRSTGRQDRGTPGHTVSSHIRRLGKPLGGLLVILLHGDPVVVEEAKVALGSGVAPLRRLTVKIRGDRKSVV